MKKNNNTNINNNSLKYKYITTDIYTFLKETIQEQIQQVHDLPAHSRISFLKYIRNFASLK